MIRLRIGLSYLWNRTPAIKAIARISIVTEIMPEIRNQIARLEVVIVHLSCYMANNTETQSSGLDFVLLALIQQIQFLEQLEQRLQ